MKNQNLYTLRARNGEHGIDLYIELGGSKHYVTTRRSNGLLYQKLKDGVTIGELRRFKPRQSRAEQKYFRTTQHLLKVVDDYLKYEIAA